MDIEVEFLNDKKIEDIIYFVKANDTLSSIADKFCVKKEDLAFDNDIKLSEKIEDGDIIWIRKRNTAIHIVKPLETIETIAKKYNVTIAHIKQLNNVDTVFIGQRIII